MLAEREEIRRGNKEHLKKKKKEWIFWGQEKTKWQRNESNTEWNYLMRYSDRSKKATNVAKTASSFSSAWADFRLLSSDYSPLASSSSSI